MLIILKVLLLVYLIAAFAAFITCWLEQGPPAYFDHASTYGDERLNWKERLMLIIFLPAILIFVWLNDKWPGVKDMLVELYVTIVLGRQPSPKDFRDPPAHTGDEAP